MADTPDKALGSSPIGAGSRVTLHFSLALDDGTEAVSTFGEEPLTFKVGDGTMVATLEENLNGLAAGDKRTFLLMPEQAFGHQDPSRTHVMPRTDFAELPRPGQVIAFALPNGDEAAGTVLTADEQEVRVNFNHPLAGHNVVFRVEILDVEPGRSLQ